MKGIPKLQVLVVDDHQVVRDGLRFTLEAAGGIACLLAETAESALELLARGVPLDVVLLDISLPGMSGLDALAEIHKRRPQLAVLLLSMYPEEQYAVRALRMGAAGYLSKSAPSTQVLKAVKAAAKGATYLSGHIAAQIARGVGLEGNHPLHESLSNREFEILRLLALGHSIRDIAEKLCLTYKTIANYQSSIRQKLGADTSVQLIRIATEHGLLDANGLASG